MNLPPLSTVALSPAIVPLLESLLFSAALFLLVAPLGAWMGWVLTTRRLSNLMRMIAWGGVFTALLTPMRLVAEGVPLSWIELYQGRVALLFVLFFFTLAAAILLAARLFSLTAAVSRKERYQLGLVDRIAPAVVVRPLLLRLSGWVVALSLLVVNFDFSVAERLGVETLPVVLYTLDQPEPLLLLQWVGIMLVALLLLRTVFMLPVLSAEQVDAARVPMRAGAFLLMLLISLLYTPLGTVVGLFVYG
jgi:hypothetical protein